MYESMRNPSHGLSAYNRGCRCDECKRASREARARHRANVRAGVTPQPARARVDGDRRGRLSGVGALSVFDDDASAVVEAVTRGAWLRAQNTPVVHFVAPVAGRWSAT